MHDLKAKVDMHKKKKCCLVDCVRHTWVDGIADRNHTEQMHVSAASHCIHERIAMHSRSACAKPCMAPTDQGPVCHVHQRFRLHRILPSTPQKSPGPSHGRQHRGHAVRAMLHLLPAIQAMQVFTRDTKVLWEWAMQSRYSCCIPSFVDCRSSSSSDMHWQILSRAPFVIT